MQINDRLYVEIVPVVEGHVPHPEPIAEAHFDPNMIYKVLGMYNPSETSECYFVLANPQREIWFISQRHLRAYGLMDSDEMFLSKGAAREHSQRRNGAAPRQDKWGGSGARPAMLGRLRQVSPAGDEDSQ